MEFYKLQINKRIQETEDSCSFRFLIPNEFKSTFKYKPGQYLTLKLKIDNNEERRAYSISSCPFTDDFIQVTIKNIDGGYVSSYLVNNVKEGDWLEVLPPLGNFTIEPNHQKQHNYIMVAGGSGITPLMSMLKSILIAEPLSKIVLLYSNRYKDNIIFLDELNRLNTEYYDRLKIYHFISKEVVQQNNYFGRLTPELFNDLVLSKISNIDSVDFYLCGPTSLMQSVEEMILESNVPRSKIHKESFVSTNLLDDEATKPALPEFQTRNIKVRVYGQQYDLTVEKGDNIIIAGIKNGLIFPYSCQIGACSTCRAKLVSGEVFMEVKEGLTEEEIKQGYILTCQSHPMSDDVVVDFDY